MFRTPLALLALAAAAGPLAAVPSSPDPKSLAVSAAEQRRAQELVQLLGNENFPDREKAEDELARMGRLARPALLAAVNADPNPEVRTRSAALLPKATVLEMRARLDVFLADAEGKYEHDLPGWNQFRAAVRGEWELFGYRIGTDTALDKAAREAFAELLSTPANRAVVMAVGGSANDLGQVVAGRRQELYYQKYPRNVVIGGGIVTAPASARRDPTPADMAALLFAESQVASKYVPRSISVSALITASGFTREARDSDEKGKVYRAVAAAWLASRTDPAEMYNALNVANTLGLGAEGCRLALRLLNAPGALGAYRGQAAATLARLGGKEHIPQLEKLSGDNAVVYSVRRQVVKNGKAELTAIEVQVRDVALAVSVLLSGQKLDAYGFVDQSPAGATYTYTRCYFPDEAARKAAFEKWKAWREKNP